MKCGACGYERRTEKRFYKEAKFFVKGQRKGELKGVEDNHVSIDIGDEPFGVLTPEIDHSFSDEDVDHTLTFRFDSRVPYEQKLDAMLYVCPKCHTVKMEYY